MRHTKRGYFLFLFGVMFFSNFTSSISVMRKGKQLFNGKNLSGWDTYVGQPYDTILKKFEGTPIGLNRDPDHVFSVVKEDGKSAIRVSGEKFGGVSTQQSFENYHLQLEFKWGKLKWHPKRNAKRDSGLLYHAVGTHGADGGFLDEVSGVPDPGGRLWRLLGCSRRYCRCTGYATR